MAKIALIHTTPVTVESLQNLIKEKDPALEIINIVDDSILPELINNNADLSLVEDRVRYYIKTAVEQKGQLISCPFNDSLGLWIKSISESITKYIIA